MTDPIIHLDGAVVLITGAAGGQGRAHAELLAGLGARVVLTDVDEAGAVAAAKACGPDALGLAHDVTSAEGWRVVVEAAVARFGRIDVLVNNAGFCPVVSLEETSPELLDRVLAVNLVGPILGMQAVLPAMRDHGGSIINISSTAGLAGYPDRVAYSASKFGLRGATRSAAKEYGVNGIRVNAICPGAVDTVMISEETRAGTGFISTIHPAGGPAGRGVATGRLPRERRQQLLHRAGFRHRRRGAGLRCPPTRSTVSSQSSTPPRSFMRRRA